MRAPLLEERRTRGRVERPSARSYEIDRAGERVPVDRDLDEVIVLHPADRPPVQRLRSDMAYAGAAREAGETAIGEERDVFAPREIPQRGGDLRGLLHPRARRPIADQHDHVSRPYWALRPPLHGPDRV